MNRRTSFRALVLIAATAAACLDPLYEDGAPLTSGWVLCCKAGAVDTCFCDEATSCQQSVYPCAGGRCSSTPLCFGGTGGGAAGGGAGTGGGGGAGGSGGGTTGGGAGGGGAAADGGVAFDAGLPDGGSDAGTPADAGVIDGGTGGGAGGGSGGGGGAAGGGGGSSFEFCCVNARVTTCACPTNGCVGAPFTPCPGGSCIAGTSTAICR
jgi:hypothetical protein